VITEGTKRKSGMILDLPLPQHMVVSRRAWSPWMLRKDLTRTRTRGGGNGGKDGAARIADAALATDDRGTRGTTAIQMSLLITMLQAIRSRFADKFRS